MESLTGDLFTPLTPGFLPRTGFQKWEFVILSSTRGKDAYRDTGGGLQNKL